MSKIACLVTNDLSHDQRMIRICSALSEAGHDVTLIGRELADSSDLVQQPFVQHRLKCRFSKGPLFYLEYNIRLYIYLLSSKFNVINTVDADTLLAAGLLSFVRKIYWIHDAHELFTEVPELSGRTAKKNLWLRLEKWAFQRINAMYTVSSSVANWYKSIVPKPIEIIRNVPAKSTVQKRGNGINNIPVLIYQGALNKGRCIEYYIEAIKEVDAVLWIVGEGDLSSELRMLAEQQGVQDKVVFWGWKSPTELKELTAQADIGLNVLEDDGLSYRYSLANKCFDYIHAGIPSIHSEFPEYRQLNDEFNIFAFAKPTVESIAQSIKLLLFDREKFKTLRDNCNIASGYLDWTTEKEKLVAIYERTR